MPNRPRDLMIEHIDNENSINSNSKLSPASYMRIIRRKDELDKLRKKSRLRRMKSEIIQSNRKVKDVDHKPVLNKSNSLINETDNRVENKNKEDTKGKRLSLLPNKVVPFDDNTDQEANMLKQCSQYLLDEIDREYNKLFGKDCHFDDNILEMETILEKDSNTVNEESHKIDIEKFSIDNLLKESEELLNKLK